MGYLGASVRLEKSWASSEIGTERTRVSLLGHLLLAVAKQEELESVGHIVFSSLSEMSTMVARVRVMRDHVRYRWITRIAVRRARR